MSRLFFLVVVCTLCVAVRADFGCGAEVYEGEWQKNPARGLLGAAFAVLGVAVVMKALSMVPIVLSTNGYVGASGDRSGWLHAWTSASWVFAILFIAGVTQLEGYEYRKDGDMGSDTTKAVLILAGALHMIGATFASLAYKEAQIQSFAAYISAGCILVAWAIIPPMLYYRQDRAFQHWSWFGFAAVFQCLLPYAFHEYHTAGEPGRINAMGTSLGFFALVSILGLFCVSLVIQHGPCQL